MSRFQISAGPLTPAIPPRPPTTHPNSQFQKQEVLLFGLKDIHQLENVGMLHPEKESHKVKENNAPVCFIYSKEWRMSTVVVWYERLHLMEPFLRSIFRFKTQKVEHVFPVVSAGTSKLLWRSTSVSFKASGWGYLVMSVGWLKP